MRESGVADGLYVAMLDPVLRNGLGSVWSAAQSGPSSTDGSAGPAALTRYRTLGSVPAVGLPSRYTSLGSVPTTLGGIGLPPASGKRAIW